MQPLRGRTPPCRDRIQVGSDYRGVIPFLANHRSGHLHDEWSRRALALCRSLEPRRACQSQQQKRSANRFGCAIRNDGRAKERCGKNCGKARANAVDKSDAPVPRATHRLALWPVASVFRVRVQKKIHHGGTEDTEGPSCGEAAIPCLFAPRLKGAAPPRSRASILRVLCASVVNLNFFADARIH